ncbi:porin family outer membrane protein [Salinisphaera sp. PC39]|uniref:outer membrane beta-barrel protein n=1 Tax=Salinisphaera sp. PC39 TaxID=1304156 RepID=UPI00333EC6D2
MKRIALVMGAALAWPLTANADISYNYVQADWIADGEIDLDTNVPGLGNGSDDYDGWSIEASGAVTDNLFLLGEYNDLSFDDAGDADLTTLGVGLRAALNPANGAADVYGMLSYEEFDSDAEGFGLTGGFRWVPTAGVEINPSVAYVDYGEIDGTSLDLDGWRYGIRGIFNVTDQVALNAEWRTHNLEADGGGVNADIDLENEIRLGARFYWM